MSGLSLMYIQNNENLAWLKCYARTNLSNDQKFDMLENYFNEFNMPENNRKELITSGHTLLAEQPLYSTFELYCKAMGLGVEYIKIGQKEALSIRMPKGWIN